MNKNRNNTYPFKNLQNTLIVAVILYWKNMCFEFFSIYLSVARQYRTKLVWEVQEQLAKLMQTLERNHVSRIWQIIQSIVTFYKPKGKALDWAWGLQSCEEIEGAQ